MGKKVICTVNFLTHLHDQWPKFSWNCPVMHLKTRCITFAFKYGRKKYYFGAEKSRKTVFYEFTVIGLSIFILDP